MTKPIARHPYSDQAALQRLLLMIAAFVHHPGLGSPNPEDPEARGDSLLQVQAQMQHLATKLGIDLPTYSIHTLRKDLATLRHYSILESRYYRQGFYLGTGALSWAELKLAIAALHTQAKHQGDTQARRVYDQITRRLRGANLDLQGELFYPVRSHSTRATTYTDPDEMARKREYRNTLFHHSDVLEAAILQGSPLELFFKPKQQFIQVYPLQLLYRDVGWYLLCEDYADGHLMTYRMDRLSQHQQPLANPGRGTELQLMRLGVAEQLLENGWGVFLGDRVEQQQELAGTLPLQSVQVRFFERAIALIAEGERRHPRQQVCLPNGKVLQNLEQTQLKNLDYVDYQVPLPGRSLEEFLRWVNRYMHLAQVLAPAQLAAKHRSLAQALVERYHPLPPKMD
jgi:WYL domain